MTNAYELPWSTSCFRYVHTFVALNTLVGPCLVGLQIEEATIVGEAVFYEVIGVRQPDGPKLDARVCPPGWPQNPTILGVKTHSCVLTGVRPSHDRNEITTHLLCRPSPSAQESLLVLIRTDPAAARPVEYVHHPTEAGVNKNSDP